MIDYQLDGKVAVITGGASGIGRACARAMARSGADVSVWDLDEAAVDDTLKELAEHGHRTHGAIVDVSDAARVDAAMAEVVEKLGRVDIAVANAGIGGESAASADYGNESWHQVRITHTDLRSPSTYSCASKFDASREAGSREAGTRHGGAEAGSREAGHRRPRLLAQE
jgi:NAD(P)-dependent dehydrogenase (short-subunit alcohol dehydrogenase family)